MCWNLSPVEWSPECLLGLKMIHSEEIICDYYHNNPERPCFWLIATRFLPIYDLLNLLLVSQMRNVVCPLIPGHFGQWQIIKYEKLAISYGKCRVRMEEGREHMQSREIP